MHVLLLHVQQYGQSCDCKKYRNQIIVKKNNVLIQIPVKIRHDPVRVCKDRKKFFAAHVDLVVQYSVSVCPNLNTCIIPLVHIYHLICTFVVCPTTR